jgi:ABC-type lipoprotein release transport system permease subunit
VKPRDPVIISLVAAIVASVAMLASWLAARGGLSVDPVAALREE